MRFYRASGLKQALGLPLALLALIVGFGFSSEYFFTRDTLVAIANDIPALLVMAVGMTFVLIIAGIDLSVGSVLTLRAVSLLSGCDRGMASAFRVLVGLICGVMCGAATDASVSHCGCRLSLCRWACWRYRAAVPIW